MEIDQLKTKTKTESGTSDYATLHQKIIRFVRRPEHERLWYHELQDNLTPMDVYSG